MVVASPYQIHSSHIRSARALNDSVSSDQFEEVFEEVIASDGAYQEVLAIDYRHPPFRSLNRRTPDSSPNASHRQAPATVQQPSLSSSSSTRTGTGARASSKARDEQLAVHTSRSAPASPSLREELFCSLFADQWETLVALTRPGLQCALAASSTQVLRIDPEPSQLLQPPLAHSAEVMRFDGSSVLSAGVGSMAVSLYNYSTANDEGDAASMSRTPSPSHNRRRAHRSRSPPVHSSAAPTRSNSGSSNASPGIDYAGGGGGVAPGALLSDQLASPHGPHQFPGQQGQGSSAYAGAGGRVGSGLVAVPENYTLPLGLGSLFPSAGHSRVPGTALDHLTVSGNRLSLQHRQMYVRVKTLIHSNPIVRVIVRKCKFYYSVR